MAVACVRARTAHSVPRVQKPQHSDTTRMSSLHAADQKLSRVWLAGTGRARTGHTTTQHLTRRVSIRSVLAPLPRASSDRFRTVVGIALGGTSHIVLLHPRAPSGRCARGYGLDSGALSRLVKYGLVCLGLLPSSARQAVDALLGAGARIRMPPRLGSICRNYIDDRLKLPNSRKLRGNDGWSSKRLWGLADIRFACGPHEGPLSGAGLVTRACGVPRNCCPPPHFVSSRRSSALRRTCLSELLGSPFNTLRHLTRCRQPSRPLGCCSLVQATQCCSRRPPSSVLPIQYPLPLRTWGLVHRQPVW